MKSRLVKAALTLVAVFIGIWIIQKTKFFPSFKNPFAIQPVIIDRTPILIKEIKSIAQLVTVTSLDEVVVDSVVFNRYAGFASVLNSMASFKVLPVVSKKLVLICKGKVVAGTDLKSMTDGDILIRQDTILVVLPRATILDVIINPSDFETFEEEGTWTEKEVLILKLKARQKIMQRSLEKNILHKAAAKSRAIIENFLQNAGYKKVLVQVKP